MSDRIVYKIATVAQWKHLQETGDFEPGDFDRESGYIHLSKASQVGHILRKRFASSLEAIQQGESSTIVIFEVRADVCGKTIKYEPNSSGEPFPHLYGELTKDMIGKMIEPKVFLEA